MKKYVLAAAMFAACTSPMFSQMEGMHAPKDGKPIPSPRRGAMVNMSGTKIEVSYGAPSLRGRKMIGGENPYGKEWRLGANEATSFKTSGDIMIAGKHVPAGSYTLFALPTASKWTLIVSKATGEWGIPYPGADKDLVRVTMMKATLPAAQEQMNIDFENTSDTKTELHVKWDHDNVWVPISKM